MKLLIWRNRFWSSVANAHVCTGSPETDGIKWLGTHKRKVHLAVCLFRIDLVVSGPTPSSTMVPTLHCYDLVSLKHCLDAERLCVLSIS
ncbi:hypothetical protein chiPu_0015348 [Chiloscyllium punctatum]|uniref:Uncharacterized protein n=1 Tax=Chiloscyllium punctatum TaxID=137246 RepID=A0A401T2J5_CHIPU|nr:hypothetical protein [Chiloscyllium punctatum]